MDDPTAGVHHFVYDYRLSPVYRNPLPYIKRYSQIAICNVIIGKTQAERDLRQYAIEGLVRQKHPTMLIVYGRPLTFDPGVEVRFYEGKLSQIKKKDKR